MDTKALEKSLEDLRKATGLSLVLSHQDDEIPDDAAEKLALLSAAWKEKYDRNSFIRHLLCGSLAEADLYTSAARFHIPGHRRRMIYVIDLRTSDAENAARILRQMFAIRSGDMLSVFDEKRIVLIKSINEKDYEETALSDAHTMVDMLSMEAMISARVGISPPTDSLSDMPEAFRNAVLSLEIGSIFSSSESVLFYNRLGLGRLIHDLPLTSCNLFLREVFGDFSPEDFDEETTAIIHAFFDNNLNISETARQLYVHRNTLVYRLEKLHQLTGLDLRIFDDALTLKLALMIAESTRRRITL
ncbi:MAG: helix-turn-helix domain-containing protein [Lachnospiraceae bacterium]|nr:helix-turn-helix domain-containing protein [Lachnospiraceae bacterium]